MKRLIVPLFALLFAACASSNAFADNFNFAFATATYSGVGLFYTEATSNPNRFIIYDVQGMVNTGFGAPKAIVGVLAPDTFESNDNILFFPGKLTGAFFDASGVSFLLSNGAEVNLFKLNDSYLMRAGGALVSEFTVIDVTAVSPEPSSLVLLGTGVLGGLATMRRRFARA